MRIIGHFIHTIFLSSMVSCAHISGSVGQDGVKSDPYASPRIINGDEVTSREEVPWLALIVCDFKYGPFQCAGTLVNDEWVLTSAYCLTTFDGEQTSGCRVNLGGLAGGWCGRVDEADEVQYKSTAISVHPKFQESEKTRMYDIGMILLDTQITRSSKIQPIKLPSADLNYAGQTVTVVGWGVTEDKDVSNTVRKTQRIVQKDSTCDWIWNCPDAGINTTFYNPSTNLCYGGTETAGDCWGDEGGPVILGSGANATQMAIISIQRESYESPGSSGCPSRNATTSSSTTASPKSVPGASAKLTVLSRFLSQILGFFGRRENMSSSRDLRPASLGPGPRNRNRKLEMTGGRKSRAPREDYDCWLDTPSVGTRLSTELVNWINETVLTRHGRAARDSEMRTSGRHADGVGVLQDDDPANYMYSAAAASQRIINGHEVASRDEAPWMAYIVCDFLGYGAYPCDGTLISDQYVLTAAFCIASAPGKLASECRIMLGGLKSSLCGTGDESDEVEYTSASVKTHPDYDDSEKTRKYNIGLIKLNATITRSSKIQPVTLPSTDMDYESMTAVIFGWGATEDKVPSPTLRKTETNVRDNCTCDWHWNCPDNGINTVFYNSSTNLCYGGDSTSRDCWLDEGGPVLVASNQVLTQIAVISKMRFSYEPAGSSGCPSRNGTSSTCPGSIGLSRSGIPSPGGASAPLDTERMAFSKLSSRVLEPSGRGAGNAVSSPRDSMPSAGPHNRQHDDPAGEASERRSFADSRHRSPRQDYDCWMGTPSVGTKLSMELVNWINQNLT